MKKILMIAILIFLMSFPATGKSLSSSVETNTVRVSDKKNEGAFIFNDERRGGHNEDCDNDFIDIFYDIFNEAEKLDIRLNLIQQRQCKVLVAATSSSNDNTKKLLDNFRKLGYGDIRLVISRLGSKENIHFSFEFVLKNKWEIENRRTITEMEAPSLLRKIFKTGDKFSLNFLEFKPMDIITDGYIRKIPVDMKFKGTSRSFLDFIESLGKTGTIIKSQNAEVELTDNQIGMFKFRILLFVQNK